jgi:hypothetical protein
MGFGQNGDQQRIFRAVHQAYIKLLHTHSILKLPLSYLNYCRQTRNNMSSLGADTVALPVKSQPAKDEPMCQFLKLPVELRACIYAEVVVFKSDLK